MSIISGHYDFLFMLLNTHLYIYDEEELKIIYECFKQKIYYYCFPLKYKNLYYYVERFYDYDCESLKSQSTTISSAATACSYFLRK